MYLTTKNVWKRNFFRKRENLFADEKNYSENKTIIVNFFKPRSSQLYINHKERKQ